MRSTSNSTRATAITRIHHVEIYVSNTYQAAHFYRTALGFEVLGSVAPLVRSGRDRTSVAIQRGKIRLLLTAPLLGSSDVAQHISMHGEGIKDIALAVTDVERMLHRAARHGIRSGAPSPDDVFQCPRLRACGDLVHSIVGSNMSSPFRDDVERLGSATAEPDTALCDIDHIAFAVPAGTLDDWVAWYVSGLGFEQAHAENVSTEESAMRSKVVQTADGAVRFPLLEPAEGRRRSQIDSYLEFHHGPGVQHLAFRSADIVKSVTAMKPSIAFLPTPSAYYDSLPDRIGETTIELAEMRHHGVLVDRDSAGFLFQIFTTPISSRPTLFLEVIERRGAEGFGSGNIRALFEAVERANQSV